MTEMIEETPAFREETHYVKIAGLLLAGNIQARVVHGGLFTGVEVRRDTERVIWSNTTPTWGWTSVDTASGSITVGHSLIAADAVPEDVALAVATMYDVPEDGPSL